MKLTEEQKAEIWQLLDSGEERKEIAKAFGITAAAVSYWANHRPVTRNRPSWKTRCKELEAEIKALKTENRVLVQNQKEPHSNGAQAGDMSEIVAKFKMFRQFMELSKEL